MLLICSNWQYILRVRLDVDIGELGIELGSIPIQPWYWNDHNSNSIVWMAIAFPFGIIRRREAVRPSARPSARSGPSSTRCSSLSSYLRPWREAASAAGGGTARPLLLLATAVLELSALELLQAIQIRYAWSRGRAWPSLSLEGYIAFMHAHTYSQYSIVLASIAFH